MLVTGDNHNNEDQIEAAELRQKNIEEMRVGIADLLLYNAERHDLAMKKLGTTARKQQLDMEMLSLKVDQIIGLLVMFASDPEYAMLDQQLKFLFAVSQKLDAVVPNPERHIP